jgi:hypothetical protein
MGNNTDITKEERCFLERLSNSFPRIAKALERIASAMERRNEAKEHHHGKGRS